MTKVKTRGRLERDILKLTRQDPTLGLPTRRTIENRETQVRQVRRRHTRWMERNPRDEGMRSWGEMLVMLETSFQHGTP